VTFVLRFFSVIFLFLPSLVCGAAEPAVQATSTFGSLIQVVLALFLVLGAIAASAWLLRRFGPTQMGPGGALRVLGGVMVGQRERLMLVEVGDTWLIVGVAPGSVTAVHSMPRPAQSEQQVQAMVQQPGFADWLKSAWQKRGGA
jgi:flagellar protein FliO/FliZ